VQVIVLVGEIDCREGFLVALERDYYDTIEEAMTATIQPFIALLKTIQANRKFKIYIHPIPPVLPQTRKIVVLFNHIYQKMIQELQGMFTLLYQ
jgi:hypothetical protein